jgi:hypothetical protein
MFRFQLAYLWWPSRVAANPSYGVSASPRTRSRNCFSRSSTKTRAPISVLDRRRAAGMQAWRVKHTSEEAPLAPMPGRAYAGIVIEGPAPWIGAVALSSWLTESSVSRRLVIADHQKKALLLGWANWPCHPRTGSSGYPATASNSGAEVLMARQPAHLELIIIYLPESSRSRANR